MGIPRRLGRLARGFVSSLQEDERLNERLRETLRNGRESSDSLKNAVGAAWRGAAEEWRSSETEETEAGTDPGERKTASGESKGGGQSAKSSRTGPRSRQSWIPRKYPPKVLAAYRRLGLDTGSGMEEVSRKRRELVKRYHPDRFPDPEKRVKAERLTAQINAAHDTIRRHSARSL